MRLNPGTGLNPVSENSFNEDDSDDEDDDDEIDVENDFRVILICYWARVKLGFNPGFNPALSCIKTMKMCFGTIAYID